MVVSGLARQTPLVVHDAVLKAQSLPNSILFGAPLSPQSVYYVKKRLLSLLL